MKERKGKYRMKLRRDKKSSSTRLRIFKPETASEWILTTLVMAASILIGFHVYEYLRPIKYLQIDSPVPILNEEKTFGLDDTIEFQFTGIRFRDSQPVIARKIMCENSSKNLRSFDSSESVTLAGVIDQVIPIKIRNLLDTDAALPLSDVNCSIQFQSVDKYSLPLGGDKELVHTYFTELFDLKVEQ